MVIFEVEIKSTPVSAIARNGLERDIARRLQHDPAPAPGSVHRDRVAQHIGPHIVEQADVGAFFEHFGKLFKRVDLDLDPDQMPGEGPGGLERLDDCRRPPRYGCP